mmetsp:Transcript_34902/g.56053  ORF Transcript_34902/g.56053 Transcript_34902/m.56053 type:complete len:164 (-) Transcript_34902:278-769(-)
MSAAEEVEAGEGDIFYVCKAALEAVTEKVKKDEEITDDDVQKLAFPENLGDEEVMAPVDMAGVGEDFDDVEQMVEKLGKKGTAEAFIKAAEHFQKSKGKYPEGEVPEPMTAKEWRELLEADDVDEGEEEDLMEDDECGEEEPAEDDEDGEAAEPAAKKAKTDA